MLPGGAEGHVPDLGVGSPREASDHDYQQAADEEGQPELERSERAGRAHHLTPRLVMTGPSSLDGQRRNAAGIAVARESQQVAVDLSV